LIILAVLIALSFIVRKYKFLFVHWFFEQLDRPKDFKKIPGKGAIFYMVGVVIVLLLFPKDIAMASLVILAIGDSIAPLVGQYGKIGMPFNKKKYVEGGMAGGIAAAIGAMVFVAPLEAFLAAVAAMIAEGVGLKIRNQSVDDNIIMPLVAGGVMVLLRGII